MNRKASSRNIAIYICLILFSVLPVTKVNAQINLGNLLSSGIQTIQNLTATTNFAPEDLVGTWVYSAPAVSFKGDDALSNIGGAAASTTIENKLAPYYQKAGLQNSKLTVNNDLTFNLNLGMMKLSGTIEKSEEGDLIFNFSAFGKVSIGKVDCRATKSGNTLNLTFDASKLIAVAQKISSISSSSTFKSVKTLLSNYKNMYIGTKMVKQ